MPSRSGEGRLAVVILVGLLIGICTAWGASSLVLAPRTAAPSVELQGTLAYYTLTSVGDLDGFVLTDGTQIHLPRHLARSLVFVARPGDSVMVRGAEPSGTPVVEAEEVHNELSGAALTRTGPKPRPDRGPSHLSGTVQFTLRGPDGELTGAVLQDGTVLRLSPEDPGQYAAQLTPGRLVTIQGRLLNTPFGRVVDVNRVE